jgi:hypothetical protein
VAGVALRRLALAANLTIQLRSRRRDGPNVLPTFDAHDARQPSALLRSGLGSVEREVVMKSHAGQSPRLRRCFTGFACAAALALLCAVMASPARAYSIGGPPDLSQCTAQQQQAVQQYLSDAISFLYDSSHPKSPGNDLVTVVNDVTGQQLTAGCENQILAYIRASARLAKCFSGDLRNFFKNGCGGPPPPPPQARPITLLIHGWDLASSGDCTEWSYVSDAVAALGGNTRTIGYYNQDTGCYDDLRTWSPSGKVPAASWDNNTPIELIANSLAWYIYDTYTRYGQYVNVIAHSMGGLLIDYALARVQSGGGDGSDPYIWPASLDVRRVVTLGTPYERISNGAQFGNLVSAQAQQMSLPTTQIHGYLNSHQDPQGSRGTVWTKIGSRSDDTIPSDSAAGYPYDSAIGAADAAAFPVNGDHRFVYDATELPPCHGGICGGPPIAHTGLFDWAGERAYYTDDSSNLPALDRLGATNHADIQRSDNNGGWYTWPGKTGHGCWHISFWRYQSSGCLWYTFAGEHVVQLAAQSATGSPLG